MSNQVPDRRRGRSSNPSSTSDDNENCEPLSENSEKNLQMLASMGYPASHFPSPIICNTRKRKAASVSNRWFSDQMVEEIGSIGDLDGLFQALQNMDENYINPVFKKNLLLTYNLLSGEVRRMRNGYADTLITMERRLGEKNTEIKTLIEEQQNLSDKLDEASKEIGSKKAMCDVLETRNTTLENEAELRNKHIAFLEEAIRIRNLDNDCLVKEMDRIKHEKLIEHSENAAENRRRCEKLGILMKHVNDVVLVEKKTDDKTKKKRKSSNKPSSLKI